jgi:hypothetical protein
MLSVLIADVYADYPHIILDFGEVFLVFQLVAIVVGNLIGNYNRHIKTL